MIQGEELCDLARETRKILHEEVVRRFYKLEREGHMEDLLVSSILDPRFKLMDFQGCTREMKTLAERYLRDNYAADWAPKPTPQVVAGNSYVFRA